MILVTGGTGYVGSHICVALLDAGFDVVAVDNLCNSRKAALDRVQSLCGRPPHFRQLDVRDEDAVHDVLRTHNVQAVMHLAGLKAIAGSCQNPLSYYSNNVLGTMHLVSAMKRAGVKTLLFSSSATVYGTPQFLPLDEAHPLTPINPYGRTKYAAEELLRDLHRSDAAWKIGILRYFNPVGAHDSGLIGEDPLGTPDNLLPFAAQVALGRRDKLVIWGNDYETCDGTGVRDYVHVMDVASGHLKALNHLRSGELLTANLGTGMGASVLEVIRAFETVSGRRLPYVFGNRRAGDVAASYADPTRAGERLGWKATRSLLEMCADHWRWQLQNPNGYRAT
ncbi:MAG: UDP-glucose 4-epimerase GalE [Pseudomonadota bacterium]|jgi:UDP-glucose 4-epimerase